MSRYRAMFDRLRGCHEGALGAFLMLGDPDLRSSAMLLDQLVEAGADMIEVGIPFSDPVADGSVIQAAARRALSAGVRTSDCFDLIAAFRARHPHVPIGILTYANLVVAPGRKDFFARAADAGADSLLVADLPSREAAPWVDEMRAAGLDTVLIAASNSPPAVVEEVARLAGGYTYCVTRSGTTGLHVDATFDSPLLDRLLAAGAPPPIFGFGISKEEHVRAAMLAGAAGVISGSAIVSAVADGGHVAALVARLKSGTRNDSAAH